MTWSPNEKYRYSFKRGMSGWDCWAVQVGLNGFSTNPKLVEDGVFGPITEAAAKAIQQALGVTVDGIVGPETMSRLCSRESALHEVHLTPKGLLKGIVLGESGGILPATSSLYPDGSRDYGAFQDNLRNPAQAQLREAFSVGLQAARVGQALKTTEGRYFGQPGAQTQEAAWRLAVLNYNWPAAADAIAAGHESTFTYTESGTGIKRKLADPAPWVEAYGIAGVRSGLDWTHFYVATKVVYVTSWTV